MLKKLTKITAAAALTVTSCLGTVSTVFAKEADTKAAEHPVKLITKDNDYTFGNDLIERTFTVENGKLKTKEIKNYRTGNEATVLVPNSSEEFIIQTMENGNEVDKITRPQSEIRQGDKKWTIEADAYESVGEGANGSPEKMFDGNDETYYHSKYKSASEEEHNVPHNIYVEFDTEKTIQSFRYQQRLSNGVPTASGHVEDFKVYVANSMQELKDATKPIKVGKFDNKKETFINLDKPVTTKYIRIEFASNYDPNDSKVDRKVSCASEMNFYSDTAIIPTNKTVIKTSELELEKKPEESNVDGGKTLTFTFKPVKVRGVNYTIKEVITMKHGESFMRKHLEINVPQEQASKAKIEYIDLENMDFASKDTVSKSEGQEANFWTIPDQQDNQSMSWMKGKYLELGQPYYVGAMYWGCEFPETENKIRPIDGDKTKQKGFIRYHYGKSLGYDPDYNGAAKEGFDGFKYNSKDYGTGKMTTWPAVVGAARSTDYLVVQSDFYEYIESIATPTEFRQQFNSWYDNMKGITAENIKSSFNKIEKGFTQNGVNPLDSYVVDDGWMNYSSFWDFDRRSNKFPNELYDSSLQVNQLGSNFGLWLGPRGGYGSQGQISKWIEDHNLGSINRNSGDINVSDSRYLQKLVDDIFVGYQNKFDINYWKLDGMLLHPSKAETPYHTTTNTLCTVSETYERWTDMFEKMRKNREGKDLWINLTSYTNPSPWHVQWVNSVWMQNTGDTGYIDSFPSGDNKYATAEEAMLTYRDDCYYEFMNTRQWQLPNKYFYNHDPVYGFTANDDYKYPDQTARPDIEYSTEEMRNHLYMLGTRGTAFWEYYYSPDMFNEELWDVNAEAANWIEENFDVLQKSKMFGGKPGNGDIYGYSCWNGDKGIVSIRNPHNTTKKYKLKLDELVGVNKNLKNVHGKVVVGDVDKFKDVVKTASYNQEIEFELEGKEVLILQFGEQDTKAPEVISIHGNNELLNVEFNETIREPKAEMFKVEGYEVKAAKLKADLRTVELKLNKKLKDTGNVTVSVNGVKDVVDNTKETTFKDDYYENDIVNSIVNRELDGKEINKGNAYSIDGKGGFSVTGKIKTNSRNAEIVRQDGSYVVGIDSEGYLTFELNGLKVNSKYVQKTRQENATVTSETKGIIADGNEHQFSAVKEVNGMIKLYIDGSLVASAYDEENINPQIEKGNLVFGKGLEGSIPYISVLDKALAYDEIEKFVPKEENVVASVNNKNVKITAYDVTENKPVDEKSDRPFRHLNDENEDYSNNYLELKDTTDHKKHSRYVQIDLGATYKLEELYLKRYADGRKYGPTVIELSDDEKFDKSKIVFNSDKNNVHKRGNGKDDLYEETVDGKTIKLNNPEKARYIRIYVNGNTNNSTSDHLVEFKAFAKNEVVSDEEFIRIDYSRLENLLNKKLESVYTKSSISKYLVDAKALIDEANKMIINKNAKSDKEVEDLIESIITKQNEILVKRGDVKELDALVKANSDRKQKDYKVSKEQWNQFTSALAKAKAIVKDNSDASQKDVDAARAELEKMIAFLDNNKVDTEDLTPVDPDGNKPVNPDGNKPVNPDGNKPVNPDGNKPVTPVKPVVPTKPSTDDKFDKVENEEKPNTGATSNAALLWTITLGAGAVAVALAKKKKKA